MTINKRSEIPFTVLKNLKKCGRQTDLIVICVCGNSKIRYNTLKNDGK